MSFRFLGKGDWNSKERLYLSERESTGIYYFQSLNWARASDLQKYQHILIDIRPLFFCFQIESSYNLSNIIFTFLHWVLVFGPWEKHHLFLLSSVFSSVTSILSCLNRADACVQRGFCTANFEYILSFKVYWGHATSLWVATLLKSLPQLLKCLPQFPSVLRNFFYTRNVNHY